MHVEMTTGAKILFAFVFSVEILFFIIYSGCSILFAGEIETIAFLLPIPILLFAHVSAYQWYHRWQKTGSARARTYTWASLFAPFALFVVAWAFLAITTSF